MSYALTVGLNQPKPSFQGQIARPLKRLHMAELPYFQLRWPWENKPRTSFDISLANVYDQLKLIADRENIDLVYHLNKQSFQTDERLRPRRPKAFESCWAQDEFFFRKGDDGSFNPIINTDTKHHRRALSQIFGDWDKAFDPYRLFGLDVLQGGNFFLGEDQSGEPYALVGQEYLPPYIEDDSVQDLSEILNVPAHRIFGIPQPDYHIDLGVRPLTHGFVLIGDIDKSIALVEKAMQISTDPKEKKLLTKVLKQTKRYKKSLEERGYASSDEIQQTFENLGWQTLKVPGMFASKNWSRRETYKYLNFINAIVHQREDSKLVYITNDSGSPTLNRLYQTGLKKACHERSDWPQIESVDFVHGRQNPQNKNAVHTFLELGGGVHCLTVEEPKR